MLKPHLIKELDIVDQLDDLYNDGILITHTQVNIAKALLRNTLNVNDPVIWARNFYNSMPITGSGVLLAGMGTEVHRVVDEKMPDEYNEYVTLIHNDYYQQFIDGNVDCLQHMHIQHVSVILLSINEVYEIDDDHARGNTKLPVIVPLKQVPVLSIVT